MQFGYNKRGAKPRGKASFAPPKDMMTCSQCAHWWKASAPPQRCPRCKSTRYREEQSDLAPHPHNGPDQPRCAGRCDYVQHTDSRTAVRVGVLQDFLRTLPSHDAQTAALQAIVSASTEAHRAYYAWLQDWLLSLPNQVQRRRITELLAPQQVTAEAVEGVEDKLCQDEQDDDDQVSDVQVLSNPLRQMTIIY